MAAILQRQAITVVLHCLFGNASIPPTLDSCSRRQHEMCLRAWLLATANRLARASDRKRRQKREYRTSRKCVKCNLRWVCLGANCRSTTVITSTVCGTDANNNNYLMELVISHCRKPNFGCLGKKLKLCTYVLPVVWRLLTTDDRSKSYVTQQRRRYPNGFARIKDLICRLAFETRHEAALPAGNTPNSLI